ncbi:MAG: FliA/WhiG family RNA polymerase sigma factor [Armatimonadetes bacterium]|nr:FliA/WhiG family RNA polymerase sigma factor [Armatimonadota bacterium]
MSTVATQEAWRKYKVAGDQRSRDQLIKQYSHLVKITAGRVVAHLPNSLEWDDVYSAGVVGLVKAVDQFDPTRNVKFETFAIALIRGAVLEMLRNEDWVPRSMRDKMKTLDRACFALETRLGRPATEDEIAAEMEVNVQDYRKILSDGSRANVMSLENILIQNEEEDQVLISDCLSAGGDPTAEVEERERLRSLVGSIEALPEREKVVIALYYYEGLTFREIGQVMSISESRVYQLHAQAVARMRARLTDWEEAA